MKKSILIAALALVTIFANAQTLSLSTYKGTDLAKYDGQVKNVCVYRYVLPGWNTISMPFAVPADKVDEIFGSDCRLERLVGVESDGLQTTLNFMDCKAEGIRANVPYILYYNGDAASKKIAVENAEIRNAPASVSFSDINGVVVTFAAAQQQLDAEGLYGILARDNAEAAFVSVSNFGTVFNATRCYVKLSSGTNTQLNTNHIGFEEVTGINTVLSGNEKADIYNLSGSKVASSLDAKAFSQLPSGVYVVKGKKVAK